jgi:hypothetical protein
MENFLLKRTGVECNRFIARLGEFVCALCNTLHTNRRMRSRYDLFKEMPKHLERQRALMRREKEMPWPP